MLFAAMLAITLGYSMVYSALHGTWAFWTFWFPAQQTASQGQLLAQTGAGTGVGSAVSSGAGAPGVGGTAINAQGGAAYPPGSYIGPVPQGQ